MDPRNMVERLRPIETAIIKNSVIETLISIPILMISIFKCIDIWKTHLSMDILTVTDIVFTFSMVLIILRMTSIVSSTRSLFMNYLDIVDHMNQEGFGDYIDEKIVYRLGVLGLIRLIHIVIMRLITLTLIISSMATVPITIYINR